jgi:dual specificity tyrosine-phosphorylation-regulated kinase 2/3/4
MNPRLRSLLTASRRVRAENIDPVVPNPPMSPEQALHYHRPLLNEYEEKEIMSFTQIYFVGKYVHKIIPDYLSDLNYGYDDEEHNANLNVGDHLGYRFEVLGIAGAGAFGQVIRCFDHKNKCDVACKVIVNTEQMHDQGKVEAQILAIINRAKSCYVIRAFDFFVFRSHIYIPFEILGPNLFEVCRANKYKSLPLGTARLFAMQMLKGLEICHQNWIIHCDIKLENVLLVPGSQTLVKIIDFGSSCFAGFRKYEYIQSRFYRAPEVMMGIPYGPPMDIWSTALVVTSIIAFFMPTEGTFFAPFFLHNI